MVALPPNGGVIDQEQDMYFDHRSAVAMQDHRLAELRRLADRRRAVEQLQADREPPTGWFDRLSPRMLAARLRPRHV